MLRRILAALGLRPRYQPVAGIGGQWIEDKYPGDPHCKPFLVLYQLMTGKERRGIARIENCAMMDGTDAAQELAELLEPQLLAGRVRLQDGKGSWCQASPEDVAEMEGQSSEAYVWLKHKVFAAYYRELKEGDRAGKVRRRSASLRSALTSLLDHAETV